MTLVCVKLRAGGTAVSAMDLDPHLPQPSGAIELSAPEFDAMERVPKMRLSTAVETKRGITITAEAPPECRVPAGAKSIYRRAFHRDMPVEVFIAYSKKLPQKVML